MLLIPPLSLCEGVFPIHVSGFSSVHQSVMAVSCWCDERLSERTWEDVHSVRRGSDMYRTLPYLQGEPTRARESVFFLSVLF